MRGSGPEIYSLFGVKLFINCTSTYTKVVTLKDPDEAFTHRAAMATGQINLAAAGNP